MEAITWAVVITTKNRFKLLCRAIDSALAQTIPCEVVVVDDGSTDETTTAGALYPTVRFIRNEQSVGHSAAANVGIRAAQSSWIKPLDDDDYLHPNCLEVMTAALTQAPEAAKPYLITSMAENVDIDGKKLGETRTLPVTKPTALDSETLRRLMMLDQAPVGTPVQVGHNRQAALECGGWIETHKMLHNDETAFWTKLAHLGGCVFVPQVLAARTIWAGSGSMKIPVSTRFELNLGLKKLIGEPPGFVKSALALHWAMVAAKDGEMATALRLFAIYAVRPLSAKQMMRSRKFADARQVLAAQAG